MFREWRKIFDQAELLHIHDFLRSLTSFLLIEEGHMVGCSWLIPCKADTLSALSASLTWATVGCQVTVAVPIARCTAVDGAVIVMVPSVGPRVCQPRLRGRLTDVEKSRPIGKQRRKAGV